MQLEGACFASQWESYRAVTLYRRDLGPAAEDAWQPSRAQNSWAASDGMLWVTGRWLHLYTTESGGNGEGGSPLGNLPSWSSSRGESGSRPAQA